MTINKRMEGREGFMGESMKVLLLEPGKYARETEIDGSLKSMQKLVDGTIQAIYPFDDPVAVVCDDEGMFKPNPLNRQIVPEVIIRGNCFICGLSEDRFCSLSDALLETYKKMFFYPEVFIRKREEIVALQVLEPEWRFLQQLQGISSKEMQPKGRERNDKEQSR